MKQILLSLLLFVFGFSAIADTGDKGQAINNKQLKTAKISDGAASDQAFENQNLPVFRAKNLKAPAGEVVGTTTYDLQTNSGMCRRVTSNPPGSFTYVAWTMGQDYTTGAANRGTGLNFYNRNTGKWGPQPTKRIEPTTRVGWPSIGFTQGRQFSITHSGSTGLTFTYRTGNQSDWTEVLVGSDVKDVDGVWARSAVSSPHIYCVIGRLGATFGGIEGGLNYIRSPDSGKTWESLGSLEDDYSQHYPLMSADDYQIDAIDSVVSIIFGSYTGDLVLYKSDNRGDSWKKTFVNTNSNPKSENIGTGAEPDYSIDPHFGSDGGNAIIMDSDGLCHVVYSAHISYNLFDNDVNEGSAYPPLDWVSALFYWNESMSKPQIIGKTVMNDNNGDGNLGSYLNNVFPLLSAQYSNAVCQPQLGIDADDNLYVSYAAAVDGHFVPTVVEAETSVDSDLVMESQEYPQDTVLFYDVFMIKSLDKGNSWQGPLNVTNAPGSEEIYPSIARSIKDTIFLVYQHDVLPGNIFQPGTPVQSFATLNEIAVVKLVPEDINDDVAPPDSEPYVSSIYDAIPQFGILTVPQNCSADNSLFLRANAWGLDYPDGLIEKIQTTEGMADYSTVGTYKEAIYVEDSSGNKSDTLHIDVEVIEDTLPPEIKISGTCTEFSVLAGSEWTKPDVIITDYVMINDKREDSGCDISGNLQVEDNVNTDEVGSYTIIYTVSDFSDNEDTLALNVEVIQEDTEGPEIAVNGLPEVIGIFEFFDSEDVEILVKDNVDCENVTIDIEGLEEINTEEFGEYTVKVTATDQSGNKTVEEILVKIGDTTPPEIDLDGPNTVKVIEPGQCGDDEMYDANDEWGYSARDIYGKDVVDVTGEVEVVYNDGNPIDCNCSDDGNKFYVITYTVTDDAGNKSVAERSVKVSSCVGIEDNPIYEFVDIFPNPTKGHVNILTANLKVAEISVYNLLGKNILTVAENEVNALTKLDLSDQAEGVYMVNVITDKGTITRKVNLVNK